ncbi:MAG: hypothetical protein DMF78_04980 [Acidobacteria bacterium]|nr:MAG: hypothetical protein DMF78_04980 [Acidobacteriota bacterium]
MGDLPASLRRPPAGPHLRGQLFQARFEYLRREHGPAMVRTVLEALEEPDRAALSGLEREGWYPLGTLLRLDRAIARLTAPEDDGIYERLGRASARHRTEWLGADARLYSVHGFLARAAEDHGRFHSFGKAAYRRGGFTEGDIAFSAYPETDEAFCRASAGYLRAAVEFLTGGPAAVEERGCQCRGDAACHFWIRWGEQAKSHVPVSASRD